MADSYVSTNPMDNLGKGRLALAILEQETIKLHHDTPQDLEIRETFSRWLSKCGESIP